ncbi:type I-E CRISPR-associated protein Cse2/CasB [Nonomuraea wenchangensis]|uniref:type I-E CRISPR-associated protein Cse2/CasB n=1 Tax=Nonomuraea wenchangensis TaxID=568860 RepID=UPI00332911FA
MSSPAPSQERNEARQRRGRFVTHLYGLHSKLESGSAYQVSEARRTLAQLRRSLSGPQAAAEAYATVFPFDPPHAEQQAWILVAGLFALHPQARPAPNRDRQSRSLGRSMRTLADRRPSTERRFDQLLAVDPPSMPYYLRQAIRLLAAENVPLDYYRLLEDLVTITDPRADPERVHRVRLYWASDYHRPQSSTPAA